MIVFAFEHLHVHLSGNVGALAKIVEPAAHGLPLDLSDILRITRNLFVGSLHVASVAGISTEQLCYEVERWAKERKNKFPQNKLPQRRKLPTAAEADEYLRQAIKDL